MDDNQRLYDDRARAYADEWYANETMLPTIRDFLRAIDIKNPRVLDLGCGPGNESMRLVREGAQVVGIDFSHECIEIAKTRNPTLRFLEMDFFDIDGTLGKFDGIFACSSLIHLAEGRLEKLLTALKNVLANNGHIIDIYMAGEGQRITYPKINDETVERICELRRPERLNALYLRNGYGFVKEAAVDPSISGTWRASIFRYRD